MSFLRLPQAPPDELQSVKQRIIRKFEAYAARRLRGGANRNEEVGERYEIVAAMHLYRRHQLRSGNQISRWNLPGEALDQKVYMGHGNEYDFVVDDAGIYLGDAKSDPSGLGEYLKKAASFCMMDAYVRGGQDRLRGFLFVTPGNPDHLFRTALLNTLEILTGASDASGITGMNRQLIPTDIKLYFRNRYWVQDRCVRAAELTQPMSYYDAELREKARISIRAEQVATMDHPRVEEDVARLAAKAKWA